MTYEEQYRKEINTDPFYRVSIDNFLYFLKKNHLQGAFAESINQEDIDIYLIAVDYSIPIIMVKYFQKTGFIPQYNTWR